jgi:hypothetical protein
VGNSASAAKEYATEKLDEVSSGVSGATDQATKAADAAGAAAASNAQKNSAAPVGPDLSDRTDTLKNDGLRIVGSAASAGQDMPSGATAASRSSGGSGADTGVDVSRSIRDTASDLSDRRAGKSIFQTIEQTPLLVAGVGLLVGGLIAIALPRSEFEDDLIGDASATAKRRARDAASKGMDAARTAVGGVYDETTRQAEAEGLTADGIGKAAQDITQRVRRVAEAAVTTAFEPAQENHQPHAHGGNENG